MKAHFRGLSLMEVLVAILIVVLAIGALATMYPGLFTSVNLDMQSLRAWEICQQQIETLKNSPFANLWGVAYRPWDQSPNTVKITMSDSNFSCVYYVEKMRDTNLLEISDLVKVVVVVCFKSGKNVIGEDKNLNGILNSGEDAPPADSKISSPTTLTTLVMEH
jgi:Tfp pilus assembly protein PilV